jgi:tetratricopeptide (TPR) repeat protein
MPYFHLRPAILIVLLLALSSVRVHAQSNPSVNTVHEASQLEQAGAYAQAESKWREITIASPKYADAWAHLGLMLALQQNYSEAVPAYRKALQLGSHLPGLHLDLGLALFKQEKLQDAIPPLKAAVAEAPKDPKPQLLLAMSYYSLGQYSDAIPYLQFAVASSPENIQLHTTLAQSCLWAEQYMCTLEQYQQILALNPDSAQADILAGEAFDGLNEPEKAIDQFRAAEKASPHEPDVHFGLGYLLWKQHQFDEAEKEFKLELADNPSHVQALTYLGDITLKHNDQANAASYLTQAAAQSGATRLTYFDLGVLHASQGHNDEAVKDFQRAISLEPDNVDDHWRLARLYASMGRQQEAQVEFAKAKELHQKEDESLVRRMSGGQTN